jgi:hypothetical protein
MEKISTSEKDDLIILEDPSNPEILDCGEGDLMKLGFKVKQIDVDNSLNCGWTFVDVTVSKPTTGDNTLIYPITAIIRDGYIFRIIKQPKVEDQYRIDEVSQDEPTIAFLAGIAQKLGEEVLELSGSNKVSDSQV